MSRRQPRPDWRRDLLTLDPREQEMADEMSSDSEGNPPSWVEEALAKAEKVNKYRDSEQPLRDAAEKGDVKQVRALLAQRADVNCDDLDGFTAAHYAVQNGHSEVVSVLCDHGASMLAISHFGVRPIESAMKEQKLGCLAEMPLRALNYSEYGLKPAHTLCKDGPNMVHSNAPDILAVLAMKQVNLLNERCEKKRWSPAHYAAYGGNFAALSVLVTARVDLMIKDPDGFTALAVAQNRLAEIQKRMDCSYDEMHRQQRDKGHELSKQVKRCCELLSIAACRPASENSQEEQTVELPRQSVPELEASLSDKVQQEQEIESLRQHLAELKAGLSDKVQQEEEIESLRLSVRQHVAELKASLSDRVQQEQEIEMFRQRVAELKASLSDKVQQEQEIESLRQHVAELKASLSDKVQQEQELKSLRRRVAELEASLIDKDKQEQDIELLRQRVAELDQREANLTDKEQQEQEIKLLRKYVAELEANLSDKDSSRKKGSSRGKRAGKKVKAQLLRRNLDPEVHGRSEGEANDDSDGHVSLAGSGPEVLDDERIDDCDGHSTIPNTASDWQSYHGIGE